MNRSQVWLNDKSSYCTCPQVCSAKHWPIVLVLGYFGLAESFYLTSTRSLPDGRNIGTADYRFEINTVPPMLAPEYPRKALPACS